MELALKEWDQELEEARVLVAGETEGAMVAAVAGLEVSVR